jgi:hypothetical protein
MKSKSSVFSYRMYCEKGIVFFSTVVKINEDDYCVQVHINDDMIHIPFSIPREEYEIKYFDRQIEKMCEVLIEYPLIFNKIPKNARKLVGLKEKHLIGLMLSDCKHKLHCLHSHSPA